MAESELRQWGNKDFANNYLKIADLLVVGRKRSLQTMKSFYSHFLLQNKPNTILDLGCGDGILTRELLSVDDSISATLIDGSVDMLETARQKLPGIKDVKFIHSSFQELIKDDLDLGQFDFTVSSLAIHHLDTEGKKKLFKFIYAHLEDGGYFMNIDTVRAQSDKIEEWQIALWKEGVMEKQPPPEAEAIFEQMVSQYTEEFHYNNVDSLESQMTALKEIGFQNVDCCFKRGMFAIYCGTK